MRRDEKLPPLSESSAGLIQVTRKADPLNEGHDIQRVPAEQVAIDLEDGLKSCRALLNDYRTKITGAPVADNNNEPGDVDLSSSG